MKTTLSIEKTPRGTALVVSDSKHTIRHVVSVEEMYALASFMLGRLYAKVKPTKEKR